MFQVWPNKHQIGWNNSTPWPADCAPTDAAQDVLCFPCSKATLLTHACLTLHEDFCVLFSRATLQPLGPQYVLLLRIVLCHSEHFMFYLSLRLVILVCLIFQLVKVFMWDGFSSGLAISPPTLVSDTKLMRLCLILVICVIYEHREWHYPSWRFTGHVLSVHLFSVI